MTAAAIEDPGGDPEITIQKKERSDILRNCLSRLSPEHREIIDLVYYHEMAIREIVGIPEKTVKTRMFHARKRPSALLSAAASIGKGILSQEEHTLCAIDAKCRRLCDADR